MQKLTKNSQGLYQFDAWYNTALGIISIEDARGWKGGFILQGFEAVEGMLFDTFESAEAFLNEAHKAKLKNLIEQGSPDDFMGDLLEIISAYKA